MLLELEAIGIDALLHNDYLGTRQVEVLRKSLSELPGADNPNQWKIKRRLGTELLRVGEAEQSIDAYEDAVKSLELRLERSKKGKKGLRQELSDLYSELGTAYLRLAEDRNCCLRSNSDSCLLPIRDGGLHTDTFGSQHAIEWFTKTLEMTKPISSTYREARWLLNIAHMTLGSYPDGVGEDYRIDPEVFASDEVFPRFTEVGTQAGLGGAGLAGGLVAEDFDGDGLIDLMTSDSDTAGQLRLFINTGAGQFDERTNQAGLTGLVGGLNLVSADYDGDGDVDVLVLRGAWWRAHGRHPNSLLANQGDGTFRDVTFDAGLEGRWPTQTAAFADFDNDGDLDLFIGNESDPSTPAPCELYANDGQGHFENVTLAAGVSNDRYTKAVSWGDYDGDRYPDLYVSNMAAPNRLYHNNGDGTFTDIAVAAGVELPISGFPAWFFDFDNDGALDIFAASYGEYKTPPSVAKVATSYLRAQRKNNEHPKDGRMHLYQGDGHGSFDEVAAQHGLDIYTLPMGSNFGDIDSDGFLDIYLGTGFPFYEGLMPNMLLRNQAGQGFADVTTAANVGHLQKGHGIAFADVDEDGDQDLIARMGGAYPGDAYRCVLFENPGNGNHWIKLGLVGETSNRFGVGALIRLDIIAEDGKTESSIYRTVGTGGSFGCNSLRQEIGLGTASKIARLEVYWPTSDTRQLFENVPLDETIEVREGSETLGGVGSRPDAR